MNAKTDFTLSFDPDAWECSVVTHTPRSWLPSSIRSRQALDPRAWQAPSTAACEGKPTVALESGGHRVALISGPLSCRASTPVCSAEP
jgi:hypothetical protein